MSFQNLGLTSLGGLGQLVGTIAQGGIQLAAGSLGLLGSVGVAGVQGALSAVGGVAVR